MVGTVIALVVGVALAIAFVALPWLMPKQRRRHARSIQHGAIDPLDEIYHPSGHETKQIWEAQAELPAPAPDPGDPPFRDGKVTIQL